MTIPRHYGVAGFVQMIFEAVATAICIVSAAAIVLPIFFRKEKSS
jgi:hypothetical protein